MELLLTIAVVAIVAASTVPTFFGGAKEVLEDTKKIKYAHSLSTC